MDIALQKRELRDAMRIILEGIPSHERRMAGHAICVHMKPWLDEIGRGRSLSVGLFKSLHDEITTEPLDEMLQERSARRAVTCASVNNGLPFFRLLHDQSVVSSWNKAHPFDPSLLDLDVIFLPGLAFDGLGNRLGRGRGCYDRALGDMASWHKRPQLVGLLLDDQLLTKIPVASHDVALDYLCTPQRGLFKVPARGSHA